MNDTKETEKKESEFIEMKKPLSMRNLQSK